MSIISRRKLFYQSGIFVTTLTLAWLLSSSISPVSDSHAEKLNVEVLIRPTISLKLTKSKIRLLGTPTPEGSFVSDSVKAQVTTNSSLGYTLSMSAETEETGLKHIESSASEKISNLDSSIAKGSFPVNRWGYSMDQNLYNPIPAVSQPVVIKNSDQEALDDETEVNFATKIGTGLKAGKYKNVIVFSALAKFDPEDRLKDISYLQEMTPEVCRNTTTPRQGVTETTTSHTTDNSFVPEKDLIDIRDNRVYKVRKLADGNCWMTQNLALMLSPSQTLTPENTDIPSNFTPTHETQSHDQLGIIWSPTDTRSYADSESYTGRRFGVLYSWRAAIANAPDPDSYPGQVNQSICPKGWQLPEIEKITQLGSLGYTTGSPIDGTASGSYDTDGTRYRRGTDHDRYWSNYAASSSDATSSLDISTSYSYPRINGLQVRCVAR